MLWIQNKYIRLLSYRLENFKERGNNRFNFRCPLCGDSQKNKNKARGYMYEQKGDYWFFCHNSCGGMSFPKFLRYIDLTLYNEYLKECLLESDPGADVVKADDPFYHTESVFDSLDKVSGLPATHPCKRFVNNRKIPLAFHDKIYYASRFKTFVNELIPDKFSSSKHDNPRLVLPTRTRLKQVTGFHARALDPLDQIRYIAINLVADVPLVFGVDTVDFNKKYYVVEGPIDSMFLDNCVGACGSELQLSLKRMNANISNAILVFDNEPRNKFTCQKLHKAIKNGYNVVIWPDDIEEKDINDMVLAGNSSSEIQHMIDSHTYNGLEAELAFGKWRKC
jgi:hypothetical protein